MISLIVAMTRNGVIGNDNKLPWHLPEDLKRFKKITLGHPIIMGRKTYDSIGRPLPNRHNIVVSRQTGLNLEGADVVASLEAGVQMATQVAPATKEIFVIGGGQIFEHALPLADKLYVTWINTPIKGDAYFPHWKPEDYLISSEESFSEPIPYSFVNYVRPTQGL